MFQFGTQVMINVTPIEMHWAVLKGAVKLEKRGMRRTRNPSARSIAIKELKLSANASYDAIIWALDGKINETKGKGRCPECGHTLEYGFCKCDDSLID